MGRILAIYVRYSEANVILLPYRFMNLKLVQYDNYGIKLRAFTAISTNLRESLNSNKSKK